MSKSILSSLREMRATKRSNPLIQPAASRPGFALDKLRQAVTSDQGISVGQKESVLAALSDPNFTAELKSGAVGAALTYLVSKYLKVSPQTQILLSLAGFGIGKIIYDYKHNPGNFSKYNEKLRMYEIKD